MQKGTSKLSVHLSSSFFRLLCYLSFSLYHFHSTCSSIESQRTSSYYVCVVVVTRASVHGSTVDGIVLLAKLARKARINSSPSMPVPSGSEVTEVPTFRRESADAEVP